MVEWLMVWFKAHATPVKVQNQAKQAALHHPRRPPCSTFFTDPQPKTEGLGAVGTAQRPANRLVQDGHPSDRNRQFEQTKYYNHVNKSP
ncbi:hypothetical protein TSMEX_003627 [Taenia solium]|eukprot:TsM_000135100 transcript=TsM_000135100 gene=TsM_000135100